ISAATAKLLGGATSLSLRNTADTADNILVADAGAVTLRNSLSMPASAGGTIAPTNYGSVPVKFDQQSPSGVTSFTIPASGSIPGGFQTIRIEWLARSAKAAVIDNLLMRFNTDAGANYNSQLFTVVGATLTGATNTGNNQMRVGSVPGASVAAGIFGNGWIEIPNYTNTSTRKNFTSAAFFNQNATSTEWDGGEWTTTNAAITSITLLFAADNIVAGSIFITRLLP